MLFCFLHCYIFICILVCDMIIISHYTIGQLLYLYNFCSSCIITVILLFQFEKVCDESSLITYVLLQTFDGKSAPLLTI